MDHSYIRTFKRPVRIPTKEELAAIFNPPPLKKQKTSLSNSTKKPSKNLREHGDNTNRFQSPQPNKYLDAKVDHLNKRQQALSNAPLLNSVPVNIIPIIHPPSITTDFFTDVTTDLSDLNLLKQVHGIIEKFPPPIPPPIPKSRTPPTTKVTGKDPVSRRKPLLPPPPPLSSTSANNFDDANDEDGGNGKGEGQEEGEGEGEAEEADIEVEADVDVDEEEQEEDDDEDELSEFEKGGIMVPFIYPPPPVVDFDTLPYSLASFKKRFKEQLSKQFPKNGEVGEKDSTSNDKNSPLTSTPTMTPTPTPTPATVPEPEVAPVRRRGRKPKMAQQPFTTTPVKKETNTTSKQRGSKDVTKSKLPVQNEASSSQPPPPPPPTPPSSDKERIQVQQSSSQPPLPAQPSNKVWIQAPPLPFPPPNFMAYPLSAQYSSLTPEEVFESFIEANQNLPRTDMVVASAAGSIADMRLQAKEEGFCFKEHEKLFKLNKDENGIDAGQLETKEKVSDEESAMNEGELEMKKYYENISNETYKDQYEEEWKTEDIFDQKYMDPIFTKVDPRYSNMRKSAGKVKFAKRMVENEYSYPNEAMKGLERINRTEVFPTHYREITLTTGSNKQRRRKNLKKSLENYIDFEKSNGEDIYHSKKYHLLRRLKNLQNCNIGYTTSPISVGDSELSNFMEHFQVERDYSLVKLKLFEKYELLKNSLGFYHDSNYVYKHLNLILINKLEKLKNFFEYQRDLFQECLDQDDKKRDIFNIESKESSKLFGGITNVILQEQQQQQQLLFLLQQQQQQQQQQQSTEGKHGGGISKLNQSSSKTHTNNKIPIVHDFMPLITQREFSIITSDLPRKQKSDVKASSSAMKHKIFNNPLYDRVMITSGSDTNASDSNTITSASGSSPNHPLKRRGRRAATSTSAANGAAAASATTIQTSSSLSAAAAAAASLSGSDRNGPLNSMPFPYDLDSGSIGIKGDKFVDGNLEQKYSETGLLTKITKHFCGPMGAKSDELINDLKSMGIETRWPIGK
ncbi:hypothetical protein KGF56_002967 [Candida oxycetoniae]|uniref:Uncharacterized protein n=1 Tax=Candida oxycetoniae TaxID=497107 RepID=A0AAI9SWV2_9ASCO|nr:uncharacterized protein KGF56_002967 [Candida oxycetoniae]KAI3404206.2 hypothetical protein KGF56_002967 [Candida oxycetoniae]